MTRCKKNEGDVERLSRHGLRATRQRLAVLHVLRRAKDHPTVLEIHNHVRRLQPQVSRKTVYEILDLFVGVGLASVVTEGGEPYRYEGNTDPHYHARCRICDRLFDVPQDPPSPLRVSQALPDGFRLEAISVTFRGTCRRCQEKRGVKDKT